MNSTGEQSHDRFLPVGAEYQPGRGVSFRVWAPRRKRVEVILDNQPPLLLNSEPGGYFSGISGKAKTGSLYKFRLDGGDNLIPDPISRFQPDGVHGKSQVVDPSSFKWSDSGWNGITANGQIIYELHVGTFTPEGTWSAASSKLEYLKSLGITCIEVMPVGDFPGEFGWGYDGVALFAPTRVYGKPDDFRRFVNDAHSLGLGVILDVVYNHLGPDGNYLKEFSDHYFTKKHSNDWGESLNFDDEGSAGVREYFISNARHWISEYHLDGIRFDATHAIIDFSHEHILSAIAKAARSAAGNRSIYLIAESETQVARIVRPSDADGYGLDALWNDDFHHTAMVSLTARNEAYFTDYQGKPQEFISCCKYGYLFQGQFSAWQSKRRGTIALDLSPTAFVNYIQNHDQIANFGSGERAHQLSGLAHFKALTALLLLAPQTPLLFQGQEFAASSPFQYFADHTGELPSLIRKGRLKELSQFPSNSHPDMQAQMRDPSDRSTFECCKLDWAQRDKGWHAKIYALHRELLALRKSDPVFSRVTDRRHLDGAVIGPDAIVLRFFHDDGDRMLLFNFGVDLHMRVLPEPLLAVATGHRWEIMLSTEDPKFGGNGIPPLETCGEDWRLPGVNLELPGRSAVVLKPAPLTKDDEERYERLFREREAQRQKGLAGA